MLHFFVSYKTYLINKNDMSINKIKNRLMVNIQFFMEIQLMIVYFNSMNLK